MNNPAHTLTDLASRGAGATLALAIAGIAAVRRTKPLHPQGDVGRGVLHVDGTTTTGVALLDQPADHDVLIRHSRAIGLDAPAPDIEGIAMRIEGAGDLLFAGTGSGRWSRRALALRTSAGTCSTLLPLDGPRGPLDLRLEPSGEGRWTLSVSEQSGPWQTVGEVVEGEAHADAPVRFDPIQNPVPGLAHYPLWQQVRAPAYALARRLRPHPQASDDGSQW